MKKFKEILGEALAVYILVVVIIGICAIDTIENAGFGTWICGTLLISAYTIVLMGVAVGIVFLLSKKSKTLRNFWNVIGGC